MNRPPDRFLPYGLHAIEDEDVLAVERVMRSGVLTGGAETRAFEQDLADVLGVKHVVVCSSGTAALHLLCMALRMQAGQTLISPAMTFLASCTCALHLGAEVDFADVDPSTGLVNLASMADKIDKSTRAIVAVDYAGAPVDLAPIAADCRDKSIFIIRDACHSLGAMINGHSPAADDSADASVFSFHPVKTIAAGEGGAVATHSAELAEKIRRLREHGCERREEFFQGSERGPWVYELQELGLNYRMSEIHAALGRSQLRRLHQIVQRRETIAQRYIAAFEKFPHVQVLETPPNVQSARHLFVLLIDFKALGLTRTGIMNKLRERGIGTQVHYIPLFLQPFFARQRRWNAEDFPGAMEFYRKSLSIPLFPSMSDNEVDRVIEEVSRVLRGQ